MSAGFRMGVLVMALSWCCANRVGAHCCLELSGPSGDVVCAGEIVNFEAWVDRPQGCTFTWLEGATAYSPGSSSAYAIWNDCGPKTVKVRADNCVNCKHSTTFTTGNPVTKTVTVIKPTITELADGFVACVGEQYTFSGDGCPAGGTIQWSGTEGGGDAATSTSTRITFGSAGPKTVTLTYTYQGKACATSVTGTALKANLEIEGVNEGEEETVGGFVGVRCPRMKIILQKIQPETWTGNAVLAWSSTKVKVFTAATGGTEISSPYTVANSALSKDLWVEGATASGSLRDVELKLSPQNLSSCADTVKFTVVTAQVLEISFTGDHQMHENSNDHDGWGVGTAIEDPVWTSGGRNKPVCYTNGNHLAMTVKLDVIPDLPAGISVAAILIADGPGNLDGVLSVSLSGSEVTSPSASPLTTTGALDDMVYKATPTIDWKLCDAANSIGTSSHRIYVTYGTPNQENSFGSSNLLTEKRIAEVIDNAGTDLDIDAIASNIQQWRDEYGIDNTGATTGVDGNKIWLLLDLCEKAQCAEGALLMEQAMRLLGIPAEFQFLLPVVYLPVPVRSASSSATAPIRPHDGTAETLHFYFTDAGDFNGWNEGEGCCLVNSKLYTAWADRTIGEAGGVVGSRTAESAAHHVLLQLAENMPSLQRWRKANNDPCNSGDTVPVP